MTITRIHTVRNTHYHCFVSCHVVSAVRFVFRFCASLAAFSLEFRILAAFHNYDQIHYSNAFQLAFGASNIDWQTLINS